MYSVLPLVALAALSLSTNLALAASPSNSFATITRRHPSAIAFLNLQRRQDINGSLESIASAVLDPSQTATSKSTTTSPSLAIASTLSSSSTTDTTSSTTTPPLETSTTPTLLPTSSQTSTTAQTTTSAASSTTPTLDTSSSTSSTTSPLAASDVTSASSAQSSSTRAAASSASSGLSSSSQKSSKTTASQTIVYETKTLTSTNSDGVVSTSTAVSSEVQNKSTKSSSSTGKTWGIVGGVIGGIVFIIALVFILWKCSQRRFSSLDNDDDNIKWPELQAAGQEFSAQASTLNPLGTRRTGGAGVEMGEGSELGDDSPNLARSDSLASAGSSVKLNAAYQCRDDTYGAPPLPPLPPQAAFAAPPSRITPYPSISQPSRSPRPDGTEELAPFSSPAYPSTGEAYHPTSPPPRTGSPLESSVPVGAIGRMMSQESVGTLKARNF
ncbi:hypothetical protein P7C70_g722, partial [Phenoliferia sp. Uapishka_3]